MRMEAMQRRRLVPWTRAMDRGAELELAGQHPGRQQLTVFPVNYSEFAFEKRMAIERQHKSFTLQQREIGRLEASIERLKVFSRGGANEKFVRRWGTPANRRSFTSSRARATATSSTSTCSPSSPRSPTP